MIIEADGFKHIEGFEPWQDGVHATYENTVLLHEQVKELRELLEKLLKKLEGEETHQHCN